MALLQNWIDGSLGGRGGRQGLVGVGDEWRGKRGKHTRVRV